MADPQILKDLVKNNFPLEVGCAEKRGASSRERCASFLGTDAVFFYGNYFSPNPKYKIYTSA
jgi:hypothetical protein